MRRKIKKKHFVFKTVFLTTVFLSIISVGYSYFSLILEISGIVTGHMQEESYTIKAGSSPNLDVDIYKTKSWQEESIYYNQYSMSFKNISSSTVMGCKITIDFTSAVNSITISNYDYSIKSKTVQIINNYYLIESNKTLQLTFVISSKTTNNDIKAIKVEIVDNPRETTLDKFNVDFAIVNTMDEYNYEYDVTLTNKTGSKTRSWQVNIILPEGTFYVAGADAIYSVNGNVLIIKNNKANASINNDKSLTIRLQLHTNIVNFIPNNIRVIVG